MPKMIHFEINADDPLRAKSFYEKVFDWKIEKWKGPFDYWVISAGDEDEPGIDGGLMKRENKEDSVLNYISVKSIEDVIKKIEKNGGKIINPKNPIPGVGYYATFTDTEGNRLDLMEENNSV